MSQRTSDVWMKNGAMLRFGGVTFDAGRRLVLRGPRPVPLMPRASRLLAPAEPSVAKHALLWSGSEIRLAEGPNLIGREPPAGIVIAHPSVSREHARIDVEGEIAEVEDLGSKNGTWRGETRISGRISLADGDELRVGGVRLTYRGPASCRPGETATYG